jgi:hypothetical protein
VQQSSVASTKEFVIYKDVNEQELTVGGITRTYKLLINPLANQLTCVAGITADDAPSKIGILQYWSAASIIVNSAKKGTFKATFSVLLPKDIALITCDKSKIPDGCALVILLALWMAPCGQFHSIGIVNGGSVQRLPEYNSWVTAPYIDLSKDYDILWGKYLHYINNQGPHWNGTTRYALMYF